MVFGLTLTLPTFVFSLLFFRLRLGATFRGYCCYVRVRFGL